MNRAVASAALLASAILILAVTALPPCTPWTQPARLFQILSVGTWCR